MGANLVGASGSRGCLDQCVPRELLQEEQLGDCWFSIPGVYNRAVPPVAVWTKGKPDFILGPIWAAFNYGLIDLLHLPKLKLAVQDAVRLSRAGKEDHTAGPFIQAVHDPERIICLP